MQWRETVFGGLDRVMTRQETHASLIAESKALCTVLEKVAEELDREPLDDNTQARIAVALNGGY